MVRNTEDFIKMLYTYACIDILVYYFRMAYVAFRGISRRCAARGCCVVAGRAVADHLANHYTTTLPGRGGEWPHAGVVGRSSRATTRAPLQ